MDREDWRAIVHGVAKESDTTEHACVCAHTHTQLHTILLSHENKASELLKMALWLDNKLHFPSFPSFLKLGGL